MFTFLVEAVLISLSGVMAPGPMTAVAVGIGSRNRYAGTLMAIGHGIVEFPLMIALILGAGALFNIASVRTAIGLIGGALLLWMATQVLRSLRSPDLQWQYNARAPLTAGILLSIANPYFLIWWATVGATLLARAAEFGHKGLFAFVIAHWMCDLLWLTVLSILAFAGTNVKGRRFQQVILAVCSFMLLLFGLLFIADALGLATSFSSPASNPTAH